MEDETQITATVPKTRVKDPKRVAAGKRLGAISKAAKEKKAKESCDRERELEAVDWTIPVVGVAIVGIVGLCYVRKRGPSPEPSPEPVRERRALDSFD